MIRKLLFVQGHMAAVRDFYYNTIHTNTTTNTYGSL